MQQKYLSTSKLSKLIDINERWLREHRGYVFVEGIHYHYPNGFNNCRWNVRAMLEWVENSNKKTDVADDVLKSLCA
jgi:hypothetical protein